MPNHLLLKAHWYETLAVMFRGELSQSEAEARAFTQMSYDPLAQGLTGVQLRDILGAF